LPGLPRTTNTLGDRVRRRRLERQLLQRELAEQLGVTESTVNNWECGRTKPAPFVLPRVEAFLSDAGN
jgi:transcriptional regulator with XRE-family HTH domain